MLKYYCFKCNDDLLGEDFMKKDKRFLKELEDNLNNISEKNRQIIIKKYEDIIKSEKEKNKKITVILKELGNPKDIASKEIELLGKESFKDRVKNKISKIKRRLKKNNKSSIDKSLEKNRKDLKKQLKIEKKKLKKDLKEEKKKIKKEIKEKNNKKSFKDSLKGFSSFITKDISLKKKEKLEPKEVVEEVIEDIKEEISEVSEIVPEKKIFESKKDRNKRIILRTLGVILTVLLLFIWLWVTVVFIASIFAYLDKVRFIGINIVLFGVDLLLLWIIIMINRAVFKKKNSLKLNLIIIVVLLIIIAFGIVLFINQVSKIKTVKDVSIKYSMTNKFDTYNLPSDPDQKFTVSFNSNYKTQYTINYDDTLKDKVKVEVKYYECYYDYYIKQTSNNVYISLKLDNRDRLSVYMDDLKEGKVFDNDELSRYVVKITINSKDSQRLVIQD